MAGPTINHHGDVVSSALNVEPHEDARHQFFSETKVLRGQIQKIYAVDTPGNDPGNPKGSYTLYDVLVWKPDGSTEVVRRCRALQPFFGGTYNNFLEVLPADPGPDATNQNLGSSERPGTHVLVGFIGGQKLYGPVILGALPHTNEVAIDRRPSQSNGTYLEGEFQGFNFKIHNDGSLEMSFNGPRDNDGALINQNGPTKLSIDKNGNMELSTNASQSVKIDRVKKVIDVVNGTTEIKMEQNGSKITTTSDYLTSIVRKDAQVTVSQKAVVNANSDITLSSDTMIKLQRGKNGSPAEPFVLGASFVKFMSQFLQAVISHQHVGNMGVPTTPPINASEFASIKSSPIDDKKILSKLIQGDN